MEFEEVTSPEQPQEEVQQSQETQPLDEGGEEGVAERPIGAAGDEATPRTYTQEEWSKRESAKDTERNEAVAGLNTRLQQLEQANVQAQTAQQTQVQWGQINQELERRYAADAKAAEEKGEDLTAAQAAHMERRQQAEQFMQLQQMQVKMNQDAKVNRAYEIARTYGIVDPRPLLAAQNDQAMQWMAYAMQQDAHIKASTTVQAEAGRKPQQFDSGVATSPGDMGDKAFMKRWGAGEEENTPENVARAEKYESKLT